MIGTTTRARALRRHCLQAACLLAVALASCSDGRGPGARAGTGGSGADAGAGSGGTVPSLDPGTKAIHRLNSTEYNATVTDVLGTSLQPANGSWRGGELAGFDNIASVLGVDEAQVQRYFDAAQGLATEVMASDNSAPASSPVIRPILCASPPASRGPGCGWCGDPSTRGAEDLPARV